MYNPLNRSLSILIEHTILLFLIFLTTIQTFSATIHVGATTDDLITAINTANNNKEDDTLVLTNTTYSFTAAYDNDADGYGAVALPAITSNITVEGNGAYITRSSGYFRFFYVQKGHLTLKYLTITKGYSKGGNGGSVSWGWSLPYEACGGGGAGMGGAIFNCGTLSLEGVSLLDNTAQGGNGGAHDDSIVSDGAGGTGGGGMGGNGGYGHSKDQGGNGGGKNGGTGGDPPVVAAGYPGGTGGTGGGGGGASNSSSNTKANGAHGGQGGFGGGGGGAGRATPLNIGKIPIWGKQGHGGNGGFGGGGGGSSDAGFVGMKAVAGGAGGFGGGNGGQGNFYNTLDIFYKFGGGAGGGGGGAGLGGAIFNKSGNVEVTNCTFYGNEVYGGQGGSYSDPPYYYNHGADGSGYGAAFFNYNGKVSITNSTIVRNTGNAVCNYLDSKPAPATPSKMTLRNTIIAMNSVSDLANYNDNKIFNGDSKDKCVVKEYNSLTCGIPFQTGNPIMAESLDDNGGPTQTLELMSNDVLAKNNANPDYAPATDQRLYIRPKTTTDPPDIGAYECNALSATLTMEVFPVDGGTTTPAIGTSPLTSTVQQITATVAPGHKFYKWLVRRCSKSLFSFCSADWKRLFSSPSLSISKKFL